MKKIKSLLSLVIKKWKNLKRRWKILIILVLLIVVGVVASNISSQQKRFNSIKVEQITKQTIERKILRSGTLEYKGLASITSTTDGQVTKIFIKNGDEVKKDQKLYQVTSTASPEEKSQAWSAYLTAKNALEEAKQGTTKTQAVAETARQSLLTSEQATSEIDEHGYTEKEKEALRSAEQAARYNYDGAQFDTTMVENKIRAAEADLNVAWLQYQATRDITMTSPLAGRVENLSIEEGDIVSHLSELPDLIVVSNPKQIIAVDVGEIDAALMTAGLSADVTVDAFKDKTYHASVARIDKIGKEEEEGVVYTVWLALDEVYPELLAGMAADVEILVETKENVLAVPNEALKYNANQYQLVIGGQDKKLKEMRNIEIGIRNDKFTEVISGAAEGETILLGY